MGQGHCQRIGPRSARTRRLLCLKRSIAVAHPLTILGCTRSIKLTKLFFNGQMLFAIKLSPTGAVLNKMGVLLENFGAKADTLS
jgi:hypothetical protein